MSIRMQRKYLGCFFLNKSFGKFSKAAIRKDGGFVIANSI
jgi:hypothetical protein